MTEGDDQSTAIGASDEGQDNPPCSERLRATLIGSASRAIPARVWTVVEPIVSDLGFELVGIEYLPEGGRNVLWVYIDAENGVDVGDCAQVSAEVSATLDVEDPIPQAYELRISSPGIDRPLMTAFDFCRFAGRSAVVQLFDPLDGRRKFTGTILGLAGEQIEMRCGEDIHRIPMGFVRRARLQVDVVVPRRRG